MARVVLELPLEHVIKGSVSVRINPARHFVIPRPHNDPSIRVLIDPESILVVVSARDRAGLAVFFGRTELVGLASNNQAAAPRFLHDVGERHPLVVGEVARGGYIWSMI